MILTRRGLLGLAATAGAGLALAGCTNAPATTPSASSGTPTATQTLAKAVIGLTYIPNIQFAPFYVADAQGLYTAQGIAPTLRHHGEAEGLFTALAAGTEDFVVAGADEMLQARGQGLDLVTIAQYYRQYPVVAIVPESSDIKTAADLKGHSIGVPGKYGETWFGALVLLKSARLAESDVEISEIGYTQKAALRSGKVDAIMGFSNNDVVNFSADGVPVRTIPLVASGSVPLISVSLITTRAYLDAHADVAAHVVKATTAGFEATAADEAGAVTTSADYVVTLKSDAAAREAAAKTLAATVALWKDATGAISPTVDESQFTAMANFMTEQGLVAGPVNVSAAFENVHKS